METGNQSKLTPIEMAVLIFVFALVLIGYVLVYTNLAFFQNYYTIEDGIVEWITVIGLLLGSVLCFYRVITLREQKRGWLLIFTLVFGILLFFAAGEEISWGQRLFGIETPEYFEKNNLQKETNFHNLVVNGIRINRIIFSFFLIAALAIYLLIVPYLYRRKRWMKNFIDTLGVPLPKGYQVISFLALFALTSFLPHEKRAELLECGSVFLVFLIICYPLNSYVFKHSKLQAGT